MKIIYFVTFAWQNTLGTQNTLVKRMNEEQMEYVNQISKLCGQFETYVRA